MLRLSAVAAFAATATLAQNTPQLGLAQCTGSPSQLWYFNSSYGFIQLASNAYCLDVQMYGTTPGSVVWTNPCHPDDHDPAHQNQKFSAPVSAPGGAPLVQAMSGLAADAAGGLVPGSLLTLNNISAASSFFFNVTSPANNGTGMLINVASGLCMDASGDFPAPPTPLMLRTCAYSAAGPAVSQLFDLAALPGGVQLAYPDFTGAVKCISALQYNTTPGVSAVGVSGCPSGGLPLPPAQQFTRAADGTLHAAVDGGAFVADAGAGPYFAGVPVRLNTPSNASPFAFNNSVSSGGSVGYLVHTASGLCLDAGGAPNAHGCLDPAVYGLPFCNASLSIEARVADLVSRLTLQEKISLTGSGQYSDTCDTLTPPIPRLAVPIQEWLVETNSMVASACFNANGTCATLFPSGMNLAASFNSTVWLQKGRVVGTEMRAFNNLRWHRNDGQSGTQIGLSGFGPDINQPRDPKNGRIGELASEDPLLTGAYAAGYVSGAQEPDAQGRPRMALGLKHYAGYSLETGRFGSVGNFTLYDMWDTYLPPFEAGFVQGGASGSMCSYISLNISQGITGGDYIPACANEWLLSTVVREYWSRPDAMHTSDCGAVTNMAHAGAKHYVGNDTMAAAVAVNAGMNLNSETTLPDNLALAVELGYTTEAAITAAVTRSLTWRFRLGQFDPLDQPYLQYGFGDIGTAQNKAIAMEAAAQGFVLVKNTAATLPLKAGLKLAVIGPLSNTSEALAGDYYADDVCPSPNNTPGQHDYSCIPTVANSIAALNVGGSTVSYAGVSISGNDTSWGAALAAAASADAVVLVLGTDRSVAEEGTDRTDIGLPGIQEPFAQAVFAAAGGKPVIFILVSSFQVSFDTLLSPSSAIVLAYTPSFGAPALAAALYGANRWGRAVMTIYPHAYQNAVSLYDFGMTPSAVSPGRSYRYYDGINGYMKPGPALVTFGSGLTYSTWSVSGCAPSLDAAGDTLNVTCTVTMTGGPAGDLVLLMFHRVSADIVNRINGAHPVPISTLAAFDRSTYAAGGTGTVTFSVSVRRALALVDAEGASVLYQGLHYLDVYDGSANNVTVAVELPERDTVVRRPPPPPASRL